MEGIRYGIATCSGGGKLHLCEPIRGAGHHRATSPSRLVLDFSCQTIRRVMQGNRKLITRVHEQVRRRVGGKGVEGRMKRIRRRVRLWNAALRNESKVDVFLSTNELRLAGRIQCLTS